MELANGEISVAELLKAQAHIWNQLFNFINSYCLKCAIQLGIPDVIHYHGKPMTVNELVKAVPIHPSKSTHIDRLMRILVHSSFFKKLKTAEEEEGYVLTAASYLLLKKQPFSVAPLVLCELDPVLTGAWESFAAWFRNDDSTPFQTANGRSLWDYAGQAPHLSNSINEAMASDARFLATIVIDKCRNVFESLKSLVDVGGGTGSMAKAFASAFPELQCTSFDLPHVVNGLKDGKNLQYVGGDMFECIPPADAILFKWVLHDWNDDDCIKILKNCKEALLKNKGTKKGKVVIMEMVLGHENKGNDDDDPEESRETELLFDMLMMGLVGGKERSEKEWVKLFKAAGFTSYKVFNCLMVFVCFNNVVTHVDASSVCYAIYS